MNQPEALRLLLDRSRDGGDVTVITEGEAARVLLDLAADCLAAPRSRIVWLAEVLPSGFGAAMPVAHGAWPSKASVPSDQPPSRGLQALTALDGTCDRVVLLVSDAHALQPSALRHIQLAGCSGPHLQFIFCGTRQFFDLLETEELTRLHARVTGGLVLTLAAPIVDASETPPKPCSAPEEPAGPGRTSAMPLLGVPGPTVPSRTLSQVLWVCALALFGLGGAAGLMHALKGGRADGRAAASQAVAAVLQPVSPEPSIVPMPTVQQPGSAASHANSAAGVARPDVPPSTAMTQNAREASPASPASVPSMPRSVAASPPLITVRSQPKAGFPQPEPRDLPASDSLPGSGRSVGRQSVAAVPPHAAAGTPGNRGRRPKQAWDQPAPPPGDDHVSGPQPALGSWSPPAGASPRYIGSYATDANGVRMFHLEP